MAPDSLSVEDGTIVGPGNLRTSYWELADDALLARDAAPGIAAKAPGARRLAGTPAARLDLPDKVFGRPRFIHQLTLPDMLHGRALKPAAVGAKLATLDDKPARAVPGVVAIVRDGSFIGVVAETEAAAEAGLAALRKGAVWDTGVGLPDETKLSAWLKSQPVETTTVDERKASTPPQVAKTVRRQYSRPFIAHASMAPSCAIAQWTAPDKVHIWSHCQGVYNLRADLTLALKLPEENITVQHVEGAGCYGHNGADDVAFDAVLLARAANGRPVRLQWSREDELAWSPMGAAMAVDLEANLDARGEIVGWRGEVWSNGHVSRAGPGADPDRARGLAAGASPSSASSPSIRRWQTAAGRSATSVPALRFPGLEHRLQPSARDADPHLGAAHARGLRQRVRHRVVHGRAGGGARRGPAGVSPAPSRRIRAPARCSRPRPSAPAGARA